MTDQAFLQWIHDRLESRYNENYYTDFMHRLRTIIGTIPEEQETPVLIKTWVVKK